MKESKMAMKRALNEYRGKKDYERLLQRYAQLDTCYAKVMQDGNQLADMLKVVESQNKSLKSAVIVLFNLLLVALVACAYLWCKG